MNILIVYATYSSGTEIASKIVQDVLSKKHTVILQNAAETKLEDFEKYDLIILASPSWYNENKEGQPHHDFIPLIEAAKENAYKGKRFALFGLGDQTYADFCGAVNHLEELVKKIGGQLAAPSLKIDGFYSDKNKGTELIHSWLTQIV